MPQLLVEIAKLRDESFTGFVECILVDASGVTHAFVEKLPVVTSEAATAVAYPRPGSIEWTVRRMWHDESGRTLVEVDTGVPWGIESTAGKSLFVVLSEQIAGFSS